MLHGVGKQEELKVANTDGNNTGTVNVSANADAGFSMVEFKVNQVAVKQQATD